jgi:proteasome assembly chaperone (PAC2) family protein
MRDALRIDVRPTLRDPVLVAAFEGWNDAGEAATSAVRYLAAALKAVPLARIEPEEFYDFTVRRPEVRLADGNGRRIEWPHNEFSYAPTETDRDLVMLIGVEPHLRWRGFIELVMRVVDESGIRRVALLGAYLAEVLYSRPVQVSGFATAPALTERLGVEPSGYQGPTGIVGVLADELRVRGLEVLSLWAGLPHYVNLTPNPRGALALLQKLTGYLDLPLGVEPLERMAGEFEERISALVASDPELAEYVRQLKRREFAQ